MGVAENPNVGLSHQIVPLVVVGGPQMTLMAFTSNALKWTVMGDDHSLATEILRQLRQKKMACSDVSSNQISRAELSVIIPNPDPLEVSHPFSTDPHGSFVVSRSGVIRPRRRDQKPGVPDYEHLVFQDMNVLCSYAAHFDERTVDVGFVELMIAADVDDRAREDSIRPLHTLTTH